MPCDALKHIVLTLAFVPRAIKWKLFYSTLVRVVVITFAFVRERNSRVLTLPFEYVLGSRHALGCSWWGHRWSHDNWIVYERNWKLPATFDGTEFRCIPRTKVWLSTDSHLYSIIGTAIATRWSRCEWRRCHTVGHMVQEGQQCGTTHFGAATDLIHFGQFQ